ncbi:hypothetical protein KA478_02130 [Patescibacteria group bacterium]|nr:hypothetical protein [Patescibacteria group bacterium]
MNKKIYIMTDGKIEKQYINLALQTGSDMQYGMHDLNLIDYPGEYDLQGMFFTVSPGKGGELNYLIKDGTKVYAFAQTEDALNDEDFNADYRLFTNQHIAKMLDKMELEGEKIDLSAIE